MSLAVKRGIAFADLPARLAGRRQNAVGSVLLLAPLNSLPARRCSGVCVWCRRKRHRIDLRRRRRGSRRADRGPRRQRLRPDRFDRRLLARRGQLNGRRRGWIGGGRFVRAAGRGRGCRLRVRIGGSGGGGTRQDRSRRLGVHDVDRRNRGCGRKVDVDDLTRARRIRRRRWCCCLDLRHFRDRRLRRLGPDRQIGLQNSG